MTEGNDLVDRLRQCSERGLQGSVGALLHEAADEIEKLRKAMNEHDKFCKGENRL